MNTGAGPAAVPERCPRCGGAFRCGIAGPGPCPCTSLTLSPALLAGIGQRWRGCLCLACLQTLAAGEPLDADPAAGR